MRNNLLFFLILMSLRPMAAQNVLIEVQEFGDNPGELQMFTYVPEKVAESPALVVVLHGCTHTAEEMDRLTGWSRLAGQHGFILLYPQQKAANNVQKCFNWFEGKDIQKDQGETLSIKNMIDQTIRDHEVDTAEVFITGMSAGGAMAAVMMAGYPTLFKAGGIMSGVPYGGATTLNEGVLVMSGGISKSGEEWGRLVEQQNPGFAGPYPKLLLIHGVDDPLVKVSNADALLRQWSYLHGLSGAEKKAKAAFKNNEAVKRFSLGEEETIIRYDIDGLGHAIAVDPGEGERQGGQTDLFAKDVDFYSTYWIARFFELIEK